MWTLEGESKTTIATSKKQCPCTSINMHGFCPLCMLPVRTVESCMVCKQGSDIHTKQPSHMLPGTLLQSRYLVGCVLGSGGFSITYIGRDLIQGDRVVIKELFPIDRVSRRTSGSAEITPYVGVSNEELRECCIFFMRRARAFALLGSHGVMSAVRDIFQENGTAYLVMEHVEGDSLAQVSMRGDGRMEYGELVDLVKPLFPALFKLHESGLIHGDISPNNVLIEGKNIRLVDFDCTLCSCKQSRLTTMAFKKRYAPIELQMGMRRGPWSDVYSLCATLYACLTGVEPQHALDRVVADRIVLPHDLGVHITAWQEQALMRGLRMRPSQRFRTASQLEEMLYRQS